MVTGSEEHPIVFWDFKIFVVLQNPPFSLKAWLIFELLIFGSIIYFTKIYLINKRSINSSQDFLKDFHLPTII